MPEHFTRAVYAVLPLVEATSINKQFLLKEAGSPDALKDARGRVAAAWESAQMGDILRGNLLQKLLNFLCLMEVRKPGFVDTEVLHSIHDLALHNSLEQRFLSRVNSDTSPDEAAAALGDAVEGANRAAKVYPELSEEDERIWNRVKVYHEFPDGFRWVYAVDDEGNVVGYMPSRITSKTMNHCGNEPSEQPGNEYWELRGPDGKAYLTVILDGDGRIEESKSWGNQVNKYRSMIMPYVKWFLKDQKVTGVGWRYDNGYATHRNFGVKDFIGDDPEFVDYVTGNKPELIGNAESRILFWKGALDEGVVTVDDLKRMFDGNERMSELRDRMPGLDEYCGRARFKFRADRDEGGTDPSPFGLNRFAVLCAACGGNPFSDRELVDMISSRKLTLAEFANYDIKLLTPEVQRAFVRAKPKEINTLRDIASHVASFEMDPEAWRGLVPAPGESQEDVSYRLKVLLDYLASAKPPSTVDRQVSEVFADSKLVGAVCDRIGRLCGTVDEPRHGYGWSTSPGSYFDSMALLLADHPDVPFPDELRAVIGKLMERISRYPSAVDPTDIMDVMKALEDMGPRAEEVIGMVDRNVVAGCMKAVSADYDLAQRMLGALMRLLGTERLAAWRGKLDSGSAVALAYLANMPRTDSGEEEAAAALARLSGNGSAVDTMMTYEGRGMRSAVFAVMLKYPGALRGLDPYKRYPWRMVYAVLERCINLSDEDVPGKEDVTNLVGAVCGIVLEHADSGALQFMWPVLGETMCGVLDRCGTGVGPGISAAYRVMCERLMGEGRGDVPGAGTVFEIGREEWESMYEEYGMNFLEDYMMSMPDRMFGDDAGRFVYGKMLGMGRNDLKEMLQLLDYGKKYARKKSVVAGFLSSGIMDGEFRPDDELFEYMVERGFASADALRDTVTRRSEAGGIEVKSTDTAALLLKKLVSLSRLPSFPGVIRNVYTYLLDRLYANMGDGRHRWRVDEECPREGDLLSGYTDALARKLPDGGYVADAFVALDCPEIRGRLEGFEQANRAACDVPGQPRSKFKSSVVRLVNDTVGCINENIDAARELSAAQDAKPARKSRKKSA